MSHIIASRAAPRLNPTLSSLGVYASKAISQAAKENPAILNMSIGEPVFGPPEHLLADIARDDLSPGAFLASAKHYGPSGGSPELREAVADWYRRRYGLHIDPLREILITHGGVEAVALAILCCSQPGEAVMPSGLPAADRERIRDYLQAVFNALEVGIGLYHVELLMTPKGPVLVEINARMMGSVSPIMYQIQTGEDAFAHLIRLHLGEAVTVSEAGFHNAGITLAVGARHGGHISQRFRQEQLTALLEAYEIPHNTLNIVANKFVGRYGGNFSIMGHVIILAESPEAVTEKGHRFLCEMDALTGLETAKYFSRS